MARDDMSQRGTSFVEVMLVAVVLGLLTAMAIPRAARAAEESRVDTGAATLLSLWHAQRLHWIEKGVYATTLAELEALRLIENGVGELDDPFTYSFADADDEVFTIHANRTSSSTWSGTLTIDETGQISGTISDGGSDAITPTAD